MTSATPSRMHTLSAASMLIHLLCHQTKREVVITFGAQINMFLRCAHLGSIHHHITSTNQNTHTISHSNHTEGAAFKGNLCGNKDNAQTLQRQHPSSESNQSRWCGDTTALIAASLWHSSCKWFSFFKQFLPIALG